MIGPSRFPAVSDRLARLGPFLGTEDEVWATHQTYALMPKVNFSEAVLEPCAASLAVAGLPRVTWSDLASPRRVFDILIELVGVSPKSWHDAVQEAAKAVHGISGMHVLSTTAEVKDNKIAEYRANVNIAFRVEKGKK